MQNVTNPVRLTFNWIGHILRLHYKLIKLFPLFGLSLLSPKFLNISYNKCKLKLDRTEYCETKIIKNKYLILQVFNP